MLPLLLVSTQMTPPIMTLLDSKKVLIIPESHDARRINLSAKKESILCKHCKRTASNGIRCLGMCVADNDY